MAPHSPSTSSATPACPTKSALRPPRLAPLACPAGKITYSPSDFKPIGLIGGITSSRNIADLYTAKYGVPEVGSAITVRLYAVSDTGVRGSDLILTTVFQPVAAQATLTSDDALELAA